MGSNFHFRVTGSPRRGHSDAEGPEKPSTDPLVGDGHSVPQSPLAIVSFCLDDGEPIDHSGPSNAGPSNVAPTDSLGDPFRRYAMLSRFRRSRNVPRHLLVRGILFDGFDASGSLRMPENNDSFAIPDFIPSQEQVMGLGTILVDPFRHPTSTRPFSEQSCWKGKQAIEEWETQKVVAGSSTPGGRTNSFF
ncbi:UNVERIFIED_CONTAM: hypothetical protein Scaly_3029900 [Sesamum calycinum]|uniref:Uncharacterized protein n=1 Tax=Sesamum calycinum TaxID=2727403 RepID=A0AAW2K796_9LAMI